MSILQREMAWSGTTASYSYS